MWLLPVQLVSAWYSTAIPYNAHSSDPNNPKKFWYKIFVKKQKFIASKRIVGKK